MQEERNRGGVGVVGIATTGWDRDGEMQSN